MPTFKHPDYTHAFKCNYPTLGLVNPNVLELGIMDGRNALWLIEQGAHYTGVDCTIHDHVLDNFLDLKSRCILVQSDSAIFMKTLRDEIYDLIYIDSSHVYENTADELKEATRLIKLGGYILCDDYEHKDYPGVKQACSEFVEEGFVEFLRNWQICWKKAGQSPASVL